MRLYIAVTFNKETRSLLLDMLDDLRSRSSDGVFRHPENMHVALAFLGEYDSKKLDAAKAVMDTMEFAPFTLSVDRTGRFKRYNGNIWWAGLRGVKPLYDLHAELREKLIAEGIDLGKYKFNPHIILGTRVVTHANPWKIEPFGETITGIDLVKSEYVKGKPTYTAIYTKVAEV